MCFFEGAPLVWHQGVGVHDAFEADLDAAGGGGFSGGVRWR